MTIKKAESQTSITESANYKNLLTDVGTFLHEARHASARSVNAILTATYWEIGRRIVEFEQGGANRASYGEALLKQLSQDLSKQFGRGFSEENLRLMRLFYQHYRERISQTASGKSFFALLLEKSQTVSGKFTHADAGQMNLYLNYLKENETFKGEEHPIGLILCTEKDEAVAHYALGGMNNKVFASRYKLQLPDPEILAREIDAERSRLEQRRDSKTR